MLEAPSGPTNPETARFRVDFSIQSGPPLLKNKFGVYQTPLFPLTTLMDSVPLLGEAGVRDLRYEMGWGKPDALAYDQIGGTAGEPVIDFTRLDPFFNRLVEAEIRPLFAMTYCPVPLQSGTGWPAWKGMPNDLESWREILRRYASHYRSLGFREPRYEIWNEPDMVGDGPKMFFSGGPEEYGDLYRYGASGIRAGDPDALVGGPAAAYDMAYAGPILSDLSESIDYVSIHAYANYADHLGKVRGLIRDRPELPILLTEYASYEDITHDYGPTAPASRHPGAMRFFKDVKALLEYTDVTKVYWAQWVDDAMGLLTRDLHRKALFNAFKIYQTLLPVDRNLVSPEEAGGVSLLAASDEATAGVVLWNECAEPREVELRMEGIPFTRGVIRLYRIDAHHASYADDPTKEELAVEEQGPFRESHSSWKGSIPGEGVVYVQLS